MLRSSGSPVFPLLAVRRQHRAPQDRRPGRVRDDLRQEDRKTNRLHCLENRAGSGEFLNFFNYFLEAVEGEENQIQQPEEKVEKLN